MTLSNMIPGVYLTYRVLMGKLGKRPNILGLSGPGRLRDVIKALFPDHPLQTETESNMDSIMVEQITVEEFKQASKTLGNNKFPDQRDG